MARRSRRRSFGTIRKRGPNYYARWLQDGRMREEKVGPTWDHADRFLSNKQREITKHAILGLRPVEETRFDDFIARYAETFRGAKNEKTIAHEETFLRRQVLPVFTGRYLHEIHRADVERYLVKRTEARGIGVATRNRSLSILSALFRKAERLGLCRENPCKGIPRTKEELREPPFLDLEAQEKLTAAAPASLRGAVVVALDTGLRLGELLRLEWRDVGLDRGVLVIRTSKNKKPRTVPFTGRGREAFEALKAVRAHAGPRVPDLVFRDLGKIDTRGEADFTREARLAWEATRRAAGFPELRWHDLRHVYAVTAARAGVALGDLRALLGHSSLVMVLRYAGHCPENSGTLARDKIEAFLRVRAEDVRRKAE